MIQLDSLRNWLFFLAWKCKIEFKETWVSRWWHGEAIKNNSDVKLITAIKFIISVLSIPLTLQEHAETSLWPQ